MKSRASSSRRAPNARRDAKRSRQTWDTLDTQGRRSPARAAGAFTTQQADMAGIPESQLETWARRANDVRLEATLEAMRKALGRYNWPKNADYRVYLQGSYKNGTNIPEESDVDFVLELNSTSQHDLSSPSVVGEVVAEQSASNVDYGWTEFRADALKALQNWYGGAVFEGKNCLSVDSDARTLLADLLVCLRHRDHQSLDSRYHQKGVESVKFYNQHRNRWVLNYPKLCQDNGIEKNARRATNGWFNPTVRMFKNARTYLISQNAIPANSASSFFLQSLLHNVPDRLFGVSYNRTFLNILNWMDETEFSDEVCQDEQTYLFRDGTQERWTIDAAKRYTRAMIELWDNW